MKDDFAVDGRLENITTRFKFVPQFCRISQVPVVCNGNVALIAIHNERLYILHVRRTGGGIPRMTNSVISLESSQGIALEHLGDKPHVSMGIKIFTIATNNPGTFLAAMLKCI